MTQSTKKRSWDPQDKLEIVKSHLVGGKAVSVICEEHEITPSLYYKWQSTLFENGAESLERKNKQGSQQKRESKELASLRLELEKTKTKLADKHEVLSEVMSEHIRLKKSFGD